MHQEGATRAGRRGSGVARLSRVRGFAAVAIFAVVWSVVIEAAPVVRVTGNARAGDTVAPAKAPAKVPEEVPEEVSSIVGLGDSVPAGSACDCDTFVSLIRQALATRQGTAVAADNLATGGLTTQGLLDQVDGGSATDAIGKADLVIITIGANDFDSTSLGDDDCAGLACYKNDLARLRANVDGILGRVRALQTRPRSRIVVTGYWNVFLDGDSARAKGATYVSGSDALTRAVNRTLAETAAAKGARYVDVYGPFKGDGSRDDTPLLAADGDHPNAAGHRVIADSILSALAANGRR
ncbi:SGNH/GDSL hydrolase family protein [Nonomuraea sp. NPDC005650]|uniref:SGNH/GDSL hydrolase family protein n=1 Tax=Nonomuraea sp. NPDC005650 TaxID=3157045 RepID=UPI00339E6083